jgi:cytochrome c biogenesis protein CcdA
MTLTLPTIITAALIDSINPCAIAVLIFLLTYLVALKAKKKILSVGLTYIVTVYIVYFLAGLGLLTALANSTITATIYYLAGILIIILGLIELKDFFWEGKNGPLLKIPESKKPVIEKWVKKASLPAAIVLGFLVSAFELPCTGGVYFAILSLLANQVSKINAVVYLLIYNVFFIMPLLIIWLLVYVGYSSEKLKAWQQSNKKWLHLILGLGMIVLGALIVFRII